MNIKDSIYQFIVEESNRTLVSTDSKQMIRILSDLQYIKIVDGPVGEYLHLIDANLLDDTYYTDFLCLVESHNWYISRFNTNKIEISKKYIPESEVIIPNILYHATLDTNVKSIMKHGIKPQSLDLRHHYPDRIYVTGSLPSLKSLIKELKRYKTGNYSIIEIDTNGLDFKLYRDSTSAFNKSYYIQDITKIPNTHLTVIEGGL